MNIQNTGVPVRTGLFIGGELRDAEGGRVYDLHNPARPAELVGHAASATAQDVDQAVKAAHAAFSGMVCAKLYGTRCLVA